MRIILRGPNAIVAPQLYLLGFAIIVPVIHPERTNRRQPEREEKRRFNTEEDERNETNLVDGNQNATRHRRRIQPLFIHLSLTITHRHSIPIPHVHAPQLNDSLGQLIQVEDVDDDLESLSHLLTFTTLPNISFAHLLILIIKGTPSCQLRDDNSLVWD